MLFITVFIIKCECHIYAYANKLTWRECYTKCRECYTKCRELMHMVIVDYGQRDPIFIYLNFQL